MLTLLAIGFAAGIVTAVSPCVLPVLPIVLAGGATDADRRRPLAIVAGLVASFTLFTLAAASILSALGLPQDLLRNVAIAMLFVLAATLLFPRLGVLLERPLSRLSRRRGGNLGGGFLLGVSLGLVFVPCAGPVLATITVLAAQHRVGTETVLLTLFYALGAALPMLLVAFGGQRVARRLRARGLLFRRTMGVVLAGAALAVVFNLETTLQTSLGNYTGALQSHIEETGAARKALDNLKGTRSHFVAKSAASAGLPSYGKAPGFRGISAWLNTPGDRPLSLASLRGKVVLVDFWTYSCINCLRTLPHLRAWYARYHRLGLEIVGVHTPEFAFEHVLGNVRDATHRLGVTWPVALDNGYATWNAYSNEYWPAEYLIDQSGRIRHVHFGEGEYGSTEKAIRELLRAGGASPGAATKVLDATPGEVTTPETYLGSDRLDPSRYAGTRVRTNMAVAYRFAPRLPEGTLSYDGIWKIGGQVAVPVREAALRLHVHARDVYIVLGGRGTVRAALGGRPLAALDVRGDRLYTVLSGSRIRDGVLELRFSPGVTAYSFTFG
jgi:cytochrome c biogenesis protein CcdA/thiol-disulfide isomerase/thioredoxin